jgi:hypothetical protein
MPADKSLELFVMPICPRAGTQPQNGVSST